MRIVRELVIVDKGLDRSSSYCQTPRAYQSHGEITKLQNACCGTRALPMTTEGPSTAVVFHCCCSQQRDLMCVLVWLPPLACWVMTFSQTTSSF